MPHIESKYLRAALAANGGATGILQFASTAGFYPGAEAWLINSDAGSQKRVQVVEIVDATHLTARFIADNSGLDAYGNFKVNFRGYTLSDFSAYTTAKSSTLTQPPQVVRVEYSYGPAPT